MRNNENGLADQRKSHTPEGAETTDKPPPSLAPLVGEDGVGVVGAPALPARFLEPSGFVWGRFSTTDGVRLRWGHLPAKEPRAECVLVGGFA